MFQKVSFWGEFHNEVQHLMKVYLEVLFIRQRHKSEKFSLQRSVNLKKNKKRDKMYEEEDNYMYAEEEEPEEIPTEKWQEYSWITISAFFEEKGKLNI